MTRMLLLDGVISTFAVCFRYQTLLFCAIKNTVFAALSDFHYYLVLVAPLPALYQMFIKACIVNLITLKLQINTTVTLQYFASHLSKLL